MGCLLAGLAALLMLAVPASIAPASLAGAYVVIALLAAVAVAVALWTARRRARLTAAVTATGLQTEAGLTTEPGRETDAGRETEPGLETASGLETDASGSAAAGARAVRWICVLAVLYAIVVTVIHLAA